MASRPEPHHDLHPRQRGRRQRYLLRHWRYVEARRLLWRDLVTRARSASRRVSVRLRGHSSRQRSAPTPLAPIKRWLRPGDLVLDANGAELFWLETLLSRLPARLTPAILYRSDVRLTARFGYHPVETIWLLEQANYQVRLLEQNVPIERPSGWYAPQTEDASSPWLLATPPGWSPGEAAP